MSSAALERLSIIIVTWNGDELLRACLESLSAACGDRPEVVVVDNAASPRTRALVAKVPSARYVESPGNPGFAGGNNRGLPFCTREFVLLLNNDIVVRREPFSALVAHLDAHPEAAVVQCTLNMPKSGDTLDDCGVMLTPFGVQFHRLHGKPTSSTPRDNAIVFAAKGAAMLFRRSVLDDLEGVLFHDSFRSYYEETDFCHRVWLAGHEVHFVDTPPLDHLCGGTASKFPRPDIWSQYIANIAFSFATCLGARGRLRVLPGFLLLNAAQFLRFMLTGDMQMAGAYVRAFRMNRGRKEEIRRVRATIQRTRKLSDRELLARILVRPSLRYYLLVAQGRVGEYEGPAATPTPRPRPAPAGSRP